MKQSMKKTKQAGVYLLDDGRYYLRATFTEQSGRQCQRWRVAEGRTPLEAAAERERWVAELQSGVIERSHPAKNTVASYAELWMRRRMKRGEIANSTGGRYATALECHILPAIGHIDIKCLQKSDIEGMVDAMVSAGLAARTVNSIMRVCKALLNSAVDDFSLSASPASRVKALPESPTQKKAMRDDEMSSLLAFVRQYDAAWYPAILLLAATGIRSGEWRALQWSDIQEGGRCLLIQHSADLYGEMKSTKTGRVRRIPLSSEVYAELQRHRQKMIVEQHPGLESGLMFPSSVWGDKTGWMYGGSMLREKLFVLCDRAGIRRFSPHELRHTLISNLVSVGIDRSVIKAISGHSTDRAMEMYTHISFEASEAALQRAFEPIGERR